jgi:hypothetical protein
MIENTMQPITNALREIKEMCAALSDRTLDDRVKPFIAAWTEPPTALAILFVIDMCVNGSLCSSFELKLFHLLYEEALVREKATHSDIATKALWRSNMGTAGYG